MSDLNFFLSLKIFLQSFSSSSFPIHVWPSLSPVTIEYKFFTFIDFLLRCSTAFQFLHLFLSVDYSPTFGVPV